MRDWYKAYLNSSRRIWLGNGDKTVPCEEKNTTIMTWHLTSGFKFQNVSLTKNISPVKLQTLKVYWYAFYQACIRILTALPTTTLHSTGKCRLFFTSGQHLYCVQYGELWYSTVQYYSFSITIHHKISVNIVPFSLQRALYLETIANHWDNEDIMLFEYNYIDHYRRAT